MICRALLIADKALLITYIQIQYRGSSREYDDKAVYRNSPVKIESPLV